MKISLCIIWLRYAMRCVFYGRRAAWFMEEIERHGSERIEQALIALGYTCKNLNGVKIYTKDGQTFTITEE